MVRALGVRVTPSGLARVASKLFGWAKLARPRVAGLYDVVQRARR
jgi:hypothetical protein